MPSPTIAQALPYVNWIVLVALAVGSLAFAALARRVDRRDARLRRLHRLRRRPAGAARAGSPISACPPPTDLAIAQARPRSSWCAGASGLAGFVTVGLAYVAGHPPRPARPAARRRPGAGGAGAARRRRWAGHQRSPTACRCCSSWSCCPLATGGALAALALGHWYLVTPRLSERPLVLLTRLLTLAVASSWRCSSSGRRSAAAPARAFDAFTGGACSSAGCASWSASSSRWCWPRWPAHGDDALDGVGHRPALHRPGGHPRRHDRRGRAVRLGRPARLSVDPRAAAAVRDAARACRLARARATNCPPARPSATPGARWPRSSRRWPDTSQVVRFARNGRYAADRAVLGRRRRAGRHPARRRRRGRRGRSAAALRDLPEPITDELLAELRREVPTPPTARWSSSSARRARRPARRRRGEEARRRASPASRSPASTTRPSRRWRSPTLRRSRAEIEERFGVRGWPSSIASATSR
jgi:hypothetical protein